MADVLGYQGKNVVITGAATGMGAAAAQLLVELGANVYVLDINEVTVGVTKAIETDMKSQASIDAAIEQLPNEVAAIFNCAGVPHPPFSSLDTITINFIGLRYLTEALIPRMLSGGAIASIASTAGMAWKGNLDKVRAFLAIEGFAQQLAWLEQNTDLNADPYGFSKQSLIVYTMSEAAKLSAANIRINCISPSPTDSPFNDKLTETIDESIVGMFFPACGRIASPDEMGKPMVLLNSQLASFVSGVNLPVDYGYCAEVLMGQRDNLLSIE